MDRQDLRRDQTLGVVENGKGGEKKDEMRELGFTR